MSPSDASREPALGARLGMELAAWKALLNVLADEERALVAGDADRLPQLNASKLAQVQTLGNLVRARQDALRAAGHAADHTGMAAWLAQHGNAEHRAHWQELCGLEQEAQAMNQRIGTLIEMRLTATRQALNVLVHAATNRTGLYDQAGQSVATPRGKPLTAA
ncbi:flagella synthesis protein FlgN [Thiobacillus sedimenti]|uniref:Flagellar protein FlgN n=1 Tax=Thiobacillus sedimenti TaxID=3110231 RepID=A0ABZ1CML4_9PROT|nr:flagellar protein FlgN [Thiobacillus sp. SCUT-2]WRS40223.1 flagellar protein FlgN [Thiobacillus sp. SCUT-2]